MNLSLIITILLASFLAVSCQKENITIGSNVSETIYLDNNDASMRILIEGNTASNTFLIMVHGGPGTSSYLYNTEYISENIEDKYAIIYWDHRNSGGSQGAINDKSLNLAQMTDDLKKVIQVIQHRYKNASIFMLGHSFGGLLSSSFMTTDNCQSMLKGWIVTGGSHNYPLNNFLTRDMLLSFGQQEVLLGNHTEQWTEMISYCNQLTNDISHEQADQLNTYADDAERLFEQVEQTDFLARISKYGIKDKWPIISTLLNSNYSSSASFNVDLAKLEFSSQLNKVHLPTLLFYGAYDFVCPPTLGQDIYDNISSLEKELIISNKSGHVPMFQDKERFCEEINSFISKYR